MYLDIGLQVVEAHPLFPLFREEFSHPYISFFDLLVNSLSVIIIIIIINNFFIRVFSEYLKAGIISGHKF